MVKTKNVKRVPMLRFPEFEDEWEETRLDEVFSILNGYAFSSNDAQKSGCRWVKIADVGINEMKTDTLSYLPMSFQDKYKNFLLNKDDFVIALTRPILSGKLKIAKVGKLFDGALLNQRVGKLISNNVREYVYHFLQCVPVINKIENRIAGSDPPNLSPNEIGSIKTHITDSTEQEKIASFLSAVDKKIQQLTTRKELLEQYKKGVMQRIFSQEIRFTNNNGKDYPDWQEKKLGDLAFVTTGKSNREDSLLNGEFTFFDRSEEIRTSNIYLFDNEAIIVPGEGQSFQPKYFIGKFDLHQRAYAIMDFESCSGKYLYYYIMFFKNYFLTQAVGSTVKSLRLPMFMKMKIKCPGNEEQQKIASFLTSIDKKIDFVQSQLTQTQTFKKGLLQQMFV